MNRRKFLVHSAPGIVAFPAALGAGAAASVDWPHRDDGYIELWRSPDPEHVFGGAPGMIRLRNGRLIATMQVNSRSKDFLRGLKDDGWGPWRGKVYTSDDRGKTWTYRADTPLGGMRLIEAGGVLYILGINGGIAIISSADSGDSWSEPERIVEGGQWYSQACGITYTSDSVYVVVDRVTEEVRPISRGVYAPVVFAARLQDDLARRASWILSDVFTYDEAVRLHGKPNLFGVPFYGYGFYSDNPKDRRPMYRTGWFESNIIQIHDPEHIWYDPSGRTFHIFMRATTGTVNIGAMARAEESEDRERISVTLQKAPSGEPMLYVPLPGGQNRFHITYDEKTGLYWLLSLQTTDSMKRVELLHPKRWNLPNNERNRLALYFSKNCMDWCFACLAVHVPDETQSRHYGPAVIDGDDMHILCRSAGPESPNAHDANMITFHTVTDFRSLVY